jgi:hypothetical protein
MPENPSRLLSQQLRDAFIKLQQHIYYDNSDLRLRALLAEFLARGSENQLTQLADRIRDKDVAYFELLCRKIDIRVYPKGISNGTADLDNMPANFITNAVYRGPCSVSRLAIFCDMPFELHLIAVLWIIRYGYKLDLGLEEVNYGNRLELKNDSVPPGRTLFRYYVKQYQRWWSDGLAVAKDYLDRKKDITIASFDLKDFYHRIALDFKDVEKAIFRNRPVQSFIHNIFKMIHHYYAQAFRKMGHPDLDHNNDPGRYPLPIGLLSSSILANWYLRDMDRFIQHNIRPLHYGRYVDDILLIMNEPCMTTVSPEDEKRVNKFFKKHNVPVPENDVTLLHAFISKYFQYLFRPHASQDGSISYAISLKGLENLRLQEQKIFIYQFDGNLSPGIVNKFVEEQRKRSSEFRFMSDEEDENFEDFEEYFFEDSLEVDDLNKARFKVIEENKFKLAVYLAKLIQRKIERGPDYKPNEEQKVSVFFKGAYLIKHYIFWEKLLTLYVAADQKGLFLALCTEIAQGIGSLTYGKVPATEARLKAALRAHFQYAIEMALGLNPAFLTLKEQKTLSVPTDSFHFRKEALVRKKYVYLSLIHLTNGAKTTQFSLFDHDIFFTASWTKEELIIVDQSLAPHRIRFYEAALFCFASRFHTHFRRGKSPLRQPTDAFNSLPLLEDAFKLFRQINHPRLSDAEAKTLKERYFASSPLPSYTNDAVKVNQYRFSDSGLAKGSYRVAMVNKYVDSANFLANLKSQRNVPFAETEVFYRILDEMSEIPNLDIFVMPELALPTPLVTKYVQSCARTQTGLITGIEHLRYKEAGFNFVLTCLPITVDGSRDAVPVFRLKNHYSPEEEKCIRSEKLVVAQPSPYRYSLFSWRGLYFSTYYCFELANIFHRVLFYSKADLLCAPVWNRDTHYYSNIVESVSRDLHCYVVQVNTSQYGDTRVTRPTEQVRKDKAKIKGGTVDDYPFTLMVSDLDVATLRNFQRLNYEQQKTSNFETDLMKQPKTYKHTPPDFPKENARKRERNESFGSNED